MDDFIRLVQAPTQTELEHFTQAGMYGIHKVFPHLGPLENQEDKLIALKKLWQGNGRWASGKEILGWFFNGAAQYMSLPVEKVQKIMTTLKSLMQKRWLNWAMMGKLMHTIISILNG